MKDNLFAFIRWKFRKGNQLIKCTQIPYESECIWLYPVKWFTTQALFVKNFMSALFLVFWMIFDNDIVLIEEFFILWYCLQMCLISELILHYKSIEKVDAKCLLFLVLLLFFEAVSHFVEVFNAIEFLAKWYFLLNNVLLELYVSLLKLWCEHTKLLIDQIWVSILEILSYWPFWWYTALKFSFFLVFQWRMRRGKVLVNLNVSF